MKKSKKTFESNEEALATEKLGEIFESNRVGDSASLNALSATTKASNKVRLSQEKKIAFLLIPSGVFTINSM